MKRALLLFIPAIALASPQNPTRDELLATVKHIESLAIETQQELDAEKQAHASTKQALADSRAALLGTQTQFNAYQKATDAIVQNANKAIAERDHLLKKLHLAKLIVSALWIAIVAFVALKIPPPLGFYIAGGLALAGAAAIWVWL
jgi:hypothetical protein